LSDFDIPILLFVFVTCFWLILGLALALAKKAKRFSLGDLLVAVTIAAVLIGMAVALF
jgi:hypothetical protein